MENTTDCPAVEVHICDVSWEWGILSAGPLPLPWSSGGLGVGVNSNYMPTLPEGTHKNTNADKNKPKNPQMYPPDLFVFLSKVDFWVFLFRHCLWIPVWLRLQIIVMIIHWWPHMIDLGTNSLSILIPPALISFFEVYNDTNSLRQKSSFTAADSNSYPHYIW